LCKKIADVRKKFVADANNTGGASGAHVALDIHTNNNTKDTIGENAAAGMRNGNHKNFWAECFSKIREVKVDFWHRILLTLHIPRGLQAYAEFVVGK